MSAQPTQNLIACQAGEVLSAVMRLISRSVPTTTTPTARQRSRRTTASAYAIAPYAAPRTPAQRALTFVALTPSLPRFPAGLRVATVAQMRRRTNRIQDRRTLRRQYPAPTSSRGHARRPPRCTAWA
jgi:hypothetical protein